MSYLIRSNRYLYIFLIVSFFIFFDIASAGALHEAVQANNITRVKSLISKGEPINQLDEGGRSALYIAAQEGYAPIVKELAGHGADVNAICVNDDNSTPLIIAAFRGRSAVIELLLEYPVNIDTKDSDGYTALSWAWKNDDFDSSRLLINKGASMDIQLIGTSDKPAKGPPDGKDAFLHDAIKREYDAKFVELLIAKGANVNAPDERGYRPLHKAAKNGDLMSAVLLVKNNADVNAATLSVRMGPFYMEGATPLSEAVESANLDMVKFLVKHRASLHATTTGAMVTESGFLQYKGLNPLQFAELLQQQQHGMSDDYKRVADYLRNYLHTGGSIDKVGLAINEYAVELRASGFDDKATQMEQDAHKFHQAMQETESVYLGFDPSAILDEYASLLRNKGQIKKSNNMEDLAAWYYHVNMAAAVKTGEKYRERRDEADEWDEWD